MSKKIDTLVEDIYSTIEKGLDKSTTDKTFIEEFLKNIIATLNKFLFEKREDMTTLRLSQIGRPDKQLWYDINITNKPFKVDGKTKIKFLYGEILESLLILLAQASGHRVSEEQKMEEINGVKGHKDCRIDGTLVDVKSASSYGMKKFKDGSLFTNDPLDRKSTRLNSSHTVISYAVFCLKKKKNKWSEVVENQHRSETNTIIKK